MLRLRLLPLQLENDRLEMAKDFAAFRSRLLGLWIISNVIYVSIILHYNLLLEYGLAIAVLIFWTLFFRMIGGSTGVRFHDSYAIDHLPCRCVP